MIENIWIGNFNLKEFASKDGAESPYPHVVQDCLIDLLNDIRTDFGKPVIVNSAYRSEEHNEAVGGVKNSFHTQGLAADIRPRKQSDLDDLYHSACKHNPDGGVGRYDTFVHVDCRGYAARWDYRSKE